MNIIKVDYPITLEKVIKSLGDKPVDAVIISGFKGKLKNKELSIRHDLLPYFWHPKYSEEARMSFSNDKVNIFIDTKTKGLVRLNFSKYDDWVLAVSAPVYYCLDESIYNKPECQK